MDKRNLPASQMEGMIYLICGQRVMLDSDLAVCTG